MRHKVASNLNRKLATFFICKYKPRKEIKNMTPEERIQKSEQRIRAEKQKIAEAKKEANQFVGMQKTIKNTLWVDW